MSDLSHLQTYQLQLKIIDVALSYIPYPLIRLNLYLRKLCILYRLRNKPKVANLDDSFYEIQRLREDIDARLNLFFKKLDEIYQRLNALEDNL